MSDETSAATRFGREAAYELRTTGQIDPGKAADLIGKADSSLAVLSALVNAGQRIEAGQGPPAAVANAIGQTAASVGAGTGAAALCVAAGPGGPPCALVGIGAGLAAEELWEQIEEKNAYAFDPAPGDAGSGMRPLETVKPETRYAPEKYFVPIPAPKPPPSGGPYPALPQRGHHLP